MRKMHLIPYLVFTTPKLTDSLGGATLCFENLNLARQDRLLVLAATRRRETLWRSGEHHETGAHAVFFLPFVVFAF
jgi:hypothetical protein